jgi:hypothetical protein
MNSQNLFLPLSNKSKKTQPNKQTTKIVNQLKLSVIGLETIKVVLVRIFEGVA